MIPTCVILILVLFFPPTLPNNQRGEKICTVCGLIVQHISSEFRNLKLTKPSRNPVLSNEAILTDIIEDVCMHISRYGRTTGPDGTVEFIPAFDEWGNPVEHKNFEFNRDVSVLYEHYCVDLVDDNFDELIDLFMTLHFEEFEIDLKNKFCTQITNSCIKM